MGQLFVLQNSAAWAEPSDFIEYSARNLFNLRNSCEEKNLGGVKNLKI
jgi:hypothetical protein